MDVLSGDFNPGGKLPISHPRTVGQIPVFYGHKVSGGRSHWKGDYVDGAAGPLYPFGHGLSYTTFELTDATCGTSRPTVERESIVETSCRRTRGTAPGTRSSSSTSRDPEAERDAPVLELKSFVRVGLGRAESSARIAFHVPVAQLGFNDRQLTYVVESGEIEVFLGSSSADTVAVGSVTVVPAEQRPEKAFHGSVAVD